jgi:hypothetical protein
MKLSRWTPAFVAVIGLGLVPAFSSTAPMQEKRPRRGEETVQERPRTTPRRNIHPGVKTTSLIRAIPRLKMSLTEAVQAVEQETNGKVHSAQLMIDRKGKPQFKIGYLTGTKLSVAIVDVSTRQVSLGASGPKPPASDAETGASEGGAETEGGGKGEGETEDDGGGG